MVTEEIDIYKIPPSGAKLMNSNKPYKFICGPVGSGKSTVSMLTLIKHASEQPLHNGVRRARVCLMRLTIPELKITTIKTFLELFPETKMNYSFPISGLLEMNNEAGEHISIEIIFLSLQRKEDVKKLLSLELTIAYLNEANQMPPEIFAACQNRVGRYPSKKKGGVNFSGVICDTNAFPTNHWLYENHYRDFKVITPEFGDFIETENSIVIRQTPALKMFPTKSGADEYAASFNETERTLSGKHSLDVFRSINGYFFVLNPHADNLDNLPLNYYTRSISSKTTPDIRVNFMNHLMSDAVSNKACYPMFNSENHITEEIPDKLTASRIILGWDFGLTPTCILCYVYENPLKVVIVDEVMGENMGLTRFIPEVKTMLAKYEILEKDTESAMDPAGTQRSQSNEQKCFDVLTQHNFVLGGSVAQTMRSRLEAVSSKLYTDGVFKIHRQCDYLIQGFVADYKFKDTNADQGILKPEKNIYSHYHDALQYAMELVDLLVDNDATALDSF